MAATHGRRNPTGVFAHPGETTLPTSCFMCETGGMVVICAGTTGYSATLDLRYHCLVNAPRPGLRTLAGVRAAR